MAGHESVITTERITHRRSRNACDACRARKVKVRKARIELRFSKGLDTI